MITMVDLQQRGMPQLGVQIAIDRTYNLHNFKVERKRRRRVPGVRIGVHDSHDVISINSLNKFNIIEMVGIFQIWHAYF